jgi:VanZ family protein
MLMTATTATPRAHHRRMRARTDIYIPGVTAPTYVQKLAEQVPMLLAIAGAVGVLLATLFPLDFYPHPIQRFSWDITRHVWADKIYDFLTNVVMFVPLGIGVAARFMRGGFRRRNASVVVAGVCGLGLSALVETLQLYLPRRDPALVDLISNTAGAVAGGLLVRHWGEAAMQRLPRALADELERPSPAKFGTLLALWLAWPLALAVYFAGSLSLDSWDPTMRLAAGNEVDAGRFWAGRVSEAHVVSRALSGEEIGRVFGGEPVATVAGPALEASYSFRGDQAAYADATGKQPPLAWPKDQAPNLDDSGVAQFNDHRWIVAEEPARELTRAIRDSDAFTLITTAASDDPFQSNDRRIFTLSRSVLSRNFTLAQNESDLVVRIRNGVTGPGGSEPQFLVPDVFIDHQPRRIAVTYDKGEVRAYVDSAQASQSLKMTPAVAMIWGCFPRPAWGLRMGAAPTRVHEWVLYGLIFIPAAMLAAVQSTLVRHRRRPWLFIAAALVPPVALQVLFVLLFQQPFDAPAAGLTTLLSAAAGTIALLRLKAWRHVVVSERF